MKLAVSEPRPVHNNTAGDYQLIRAVEQGSPTAFDEALELGGSLSAHDFGKPLLEVAQRFEQAGIARTLLARGADPDQRIGKRGNTLLHRSARTGDIGFTALLVEKGAALNAQNSVGQTPLYLAIRHDFEFLAKLLIDAGADAKLPDHKGNTPLHEAARLGHEHLAKLLLRQYVDFKAKNNENYTPLHVAAASGHTEVLKLLVERVKDAYEPDRELLKRVRVAAELHGQKEMSEILLAAETPASQTLQD